MANLTEQSESVDLYVQYDCEAPVDEHQWQSWFALWLKDLDITSACELSLCLTTDEGIQQLNSQFRQLDKPTDVLSFAATETPMPEISESLGESQPLILGDIIISVPTAITQAQQQNHSLVVELAWLATHGLLHLLGWDHPDDASLQAMLARQKTLVAMLESLPEPEQVAPVAVGAANNSAASSQ